MKREGGEKNALVAKWVHLLITMAVAVFPLVVGTHETFRSPKGPSKAAETGHSVSHDPIRGQWSVRPAKKRPERERSHLMLLVSGPAITLHGGSSVRLLTACAIITTRCYLVFQSSAALRESNISNSSVEAQKFQM